MSLSGIFHWDLSKDRSTADRPDLGQRNYDHLHFWANTNTENLLSDSMNKKFFTLTQSMSHFCPKRICIYQTNKEILKDL